MSVQQNIGNVRVMSANRSLSKHDYSHHVDTSMNLGDVAPICSLLSDAGDKHSLTAEQLVWVAPVVHPVFGKMKYHMWYYYVKMSDLSNNFAALMSQTRVSRESTFKPTKTPFMKKGLMSALALFESFCTVWRADSAASDQYAQFKLYGTNLAVPQLIQDLINAGVIKYETTRKADGLDGYAISLRKLTGSDLWIYPDGTSYPSGHDFWIPLSNPAMPTFMDYRTDNNEDRYRQSGVDCSPVMLETADYVIEKVIEINGNSYRYAFAFRFSDFGRRLKKCLEASGIRLDLSSTEEKDFCSLFAIYKAYFDCFGILQYQNWEDTPCAKLLYMMDHINDTQLSFYMNNQSNETGNKKVIQDNLLQFIYDLGMMYTTDSASYVSVTTRQDSVSPQVDSDFLETTPDVNQGTSGAAISNGTNRLDSDGNPYGSPNDTFANNHAFINKVFHGQMDAELLKKLYLWTNRNTIAGQRVHELLKLQGLGKWADHQKINFIGHTETDINFETVTSMADTMQNATKGRLLGERGAKAQAYSEGKKQRYICDEIGYFVCLSAVVPESGFLQQDDARTSCVSKFQFYNPEFDAVGFEAMRKSQVCGELLWINEDNKTDPPLDKTFGYNPRYTSLKVVGNKAMGDFSLKSERENYLGYCLDRFMDLNAHSINSVLTSGGTSPTARVTTSECSLAFDANHLPVAGTVWRYSSRYPWLGHLYRIFALVGDLWQDHMTIWGGLIPDENGSKKYELFSRTYDNFLVQLDVKFHCYSRKLQIGDSYETTSDGNEGATDSNVSHA